MRVVYLVERQQVASDALAYRLDCRQMDSKWGYEVSVLPTRSRGKTVKTFIAHRNSVDNKVEKNISSRRSTRLDWLSIISLRLFQTNKADEKGVGAYRPPLRWIILMVSNQRLRLRFYQTIILHFLFGRWRCGWILNSSAATGYTSIDPTDVLFHQNHAVVLILRSVFLHHQKTKCLMLICSNTSSSEIQVREDMVLTSYASKS